MSCYDCDREDGNKALVAFIVGLFIGGILIWIFSAPVEVQHQEIGEDRVDRAEDACLSAGGIPLYNDIGRVEDCKKI